MQLPACNIVKNPFNIEKTDNKIGSPHSALYSEQHLLDFDFNRPSSSSTFLSTTSPTVTLKTINDNFNRKQNKKSGFNSQRNNSRHLCNQKAYSYDLLETRQHYNNKCIENEFVFKRSKFSDFWRYRRKFSRSLNSINPCSDLISSPSTIINKSIQHDNIDKTIQKQNFFSRWIDKISNLLTKKFEFSYICKYFTLYTTIILSIIIFTLIFQQQNEKISHLQNRIQEFDMELNVIKSFINIIFDDGDKKIKKVKICIS